MERNFTQRVDEFWLKLPLKYKDKLSRIRVWKELKVALDEQDIWVRGLQPEKLNHPEIRKIPFKEIYYQKGGALFPLGKRLPEYKVKTSLLWRPIYKALMVEMPKYNFNYFGIQSQIEVKLVSSTEERESYAMEIEKEVFDAYIKEAPSIRLKDLQWAIVDKRIFVVGTPLLPIPGITFWKQHDFLIPTGSDFEFKELSRQIHEKINAASLYYVVFDENRTYYKIPKESFRKLTLSSYRLTS